MRTIFLCSFSLFFYFSPLCSLEIPPVSKQTLETAIQRAKFGEESGELSLTHRRVSADEVSSALQLEAPLQQEDLQKANVPFVYSLVAENCHPGTEYSLLGRDCKGHYESLGVFVADEGSVLRNRDKETHPRLSQQWIYLSDFMPSEVLDYVLVSNDGKQCVATHIVPKPVEVQGTAQRGISLEMVREDGKEFHLHLKGFSPGEEYRYLVDFKGTEKKGMGSISSEGSAAVAIVPEAGEGGEAIVVVQGNSQEEPLSLRFLWGEDLLETFVSKE